MEIEEGPSHNIDDAPRAGQAAQQKSAMDKANALHTETHDILTRLDEIERLVKREVRNAAIKQPASLPSTTNAQLDKSILNLADVESRIESVRRDQERQKEKLRDGKERFSAMEASIKQRGEHVTRLEAIVRDEVPDD